MKSGISMTKVIICKQCGSVNDESRFCITCGASLRPTSIDKQIQASRPVLIENISEKSSFLYNTMRSLSEKKPEEKPPSNTPSAVESIPIQKPPPMPEKKPKKKVTYSAGIKDKMKKELKILEKLDRSLEAAAIIDVDNAELVISAFSTRASSELLNIIATTIYRINEDSLKALRAGDVKIMMLQASEISLILSPINKELVLILVTNSRSNLGMISFNSEIISQKITALLK